MKKLMIVFFSLLCIGKMTIFSQEEKLTVTGIAEVSEIPEMVILTANLRITAPLYQKCFEKAMVTYNQLKTVFEENGIPADNIKSRQIVVNENVEWRNNEKTILGYYANIQFEISEEFTEDLSEKLLKSLNTENLNLNYSVNFEFTEDQKEKIRKKALEQAIQDAKQKGAIIAAASGIKLLGISKINYGTAGAASPFPEFAEDDLARNIMTIREEPGYFTMGGVNLNPKEKTIKQMVVIEWSFLQKD